MSQANEPPKVYRPSERVRQLAADLIATIQAEADPEISKRSLCRIAMVEAGTAAFHHMNKMDPNDAVAAVSESAVVLSRVIAQAARCGHLIVLTAISLGLALDANADLGKLRQPGGPRKDAS